jgi:type I restriction enzyme M protein
LFNGIILANPPFMSPKGGIKPHKRFSIQAKRSEVLFVDYMAEHLTPTGRAGIIVPEGTIFQSQTAYRDLRKMLVENALVAVVSLPAGCFNPYSGVKTSILFLDKSLDRHSNTIAFFKVENDGFGLGAQRRAFDKNDLPQVKAELGAYLHALRTQHPTTGVHPTFGLIVPKEKIAANGDYNLSGERYREGVNTISPWPSVPVGDVFRKSEQTVLPESLDGPVTYLGLENITQNTGGIEGDVVAEKPAEIRSLKNVFKPRDILYGKLRPNLNKVWLADRRGICSTDIFVIEAIDGMADPALYAYLFRSGRFNDAVMGQLKGAQLPRIGWSSFVEIRIPLPPLDVQKELVAEIEGCQQVINGARAVLDHYRFHIPIHPDWPIVRLGEVIESKPKNGYSGSPVDRPTNLKVLSLSATTSGEMDLSKFKFLDEDIPIDSPCRCRRGDIYLQRGNTKELVGTAAIFDSDDEDYIYPDLMIRVRADEAKIRSHYLLTVLKSAPVREYVTSNAVGAAGSMPKINQAIVESIPIPLPPLNTQQAIVAEIEAEQALVAANRELISRFEKKIQATLARIWGEEDPAVPEA